MNTIIDELKHEIENKKLYDEGIAFEDIKVLNNSTINFCKASNDNFNGDLKDVSVIVDTTVTSSQKIVTGIQRVVRKLVYNLNEKVCIGKFDGAKGYTTNNKFINNLKNIKSTEKEEKIDMRTASKFVLLDASWHLYEKAELAIEAIHQGKGEAFDVVYDLIPLRHGNTTLNGKFNEIFEIWHNMVLEKADHIMCISKAVADDVISYFYEQNIKRNSPLKISYFPLGADIQSKHDINPKFVRKRIVRFFDKPTFLMVGTIEPRKGHLVAVDAVNKLLSNGKNINLLIIGRNGWNNEEIKSIICSSKYYGKNILWIEDASDYELNWSYQKASCLIAASLDEGYGLPLVEAGQYGIPLICSDIPVFREVSEGNADFFKVFDSDALAECIETWLESDTHPDTTKIRAYTWKEAADIFMEIVEGNRAPYKTIS